MIKIDNNFKVYKENTYIPRVIDGFTYFQEDDMLEIRLNVLKNVVDYFVIVEGNRTHSNLEKSFELESKLETRFKDFKDKIIYIKCDMSKVGEGKDFTKKKTYTPNDGYWALENFQRIAIKEGFEKLNIKDDDIILVSDLDEIPKPEIIDSVRQGSSQPYKLNMYGKFLFLNSKSNGANWWRPTISKYKYVKQFNCEQIRMKSFARKSNAGWHFSYCGSSKFIQKKLKSFSHSEYSHDEYTNIEHLDKVINENVNIWNKNLKDDRKYEEITFPGYPQWLVDNQQKYKHLIKEIK